MNDPWDMYEGAFVTLLFAVMKYLARAISQRNGFFEFEITLRHSGEGIDSGNWRPSGHILSGQEADKDECWCLGSLVYFPFHNLSCTGYFHVSSTEAGVVWERGTSIKKMSPPA